MRFGGRMSLKVNEVAVKNAKKLIEEGKISTESHWMEAKPSADEENQFVDKHGWNEYGKWFLAIDQDKKKDEKQHFEFPFGDFRKIYKEGVLAVKKRAAQYKHPDVEKVADELLQLIEKNKT
jgi:hypothetical protein